MGQYFVTTYIDSYLPLPNLAARTPFPDLLKHARLFHRRYARLYSVPSFVKAIQFLIDHLDGVSDVPDGPLGPLDRLVNLEG